MLPPPGARAASPCSEGELQSLLSAVSLRCVMPRVRGSRGSCAPESREALMPRCAARRRRQRMRRRDTAQEVLRSRPRRRGARAREPSFDSAQRRSAIAFLRIWRRKSTGYGGAHCSSDVRFSARDTPEVFFWRAAAPSSGDVNAPDATPCRRREADDFRAVHSFAEEASAMRPPRGGGRRMPPSAAAPSCSRRKSLRYHACSSPPAQSKMSPEHIFSLYHAAFDMRR